MTVKQQPTTPPSGSIKSLTPPLAPEVPPPVAGGEGLTVAEAARRLVQFGPNLVETGGHFRLLRTGLGLLANPLVVILLVASVVSGIVGETLSAAIIVTIVLLSVALDFFQSFHSEQAASRLQSLVTLTAGVCARRTAHGSADARGRARRSARASGRRLAASRCNPALGSHAQRRPGGADRRVAAGGETRRRRPGRPAVRRYLRCQRGGPGAGNRDWRRTHSSVRSPTRWWKRHRRPSTSAARAASAWSSCAPSSAWCCSCSWSAPCCTMTPLQSLLFALALAVGLTPEFLPMIMTVTLAGRRSAHGAGQGDRQAPVGDREPGHHGRAVQRQDRDADARRPHAAVGRGCPRRTVRGRAAAGRASTARWRAASGVRWTLPSWRTSIQPSPRTRSAPSCRSISSGEGSACWSAARRVCQVLTKGAPESMLSACTAMVGPRARSPLSDAAPARAPCDTYERLSRAGYHVLGVARKAVRLGPADAYRRRRARPDAVRVRRIPRSARSVGAPKSWPRCVRVACRSRS